MDVITKSVKLQNIRFIISSDLATNRERETDRTNYRPTEKEKKQRKRKRE